MSDIPRPYISYLALICCTACEALPYACVYTASPLQVSECISQVEQMMVRAGEDENASAAH
jgi:hypothetical protein